MVSVPIERVCVLSGYLSHPNPPEGRIGSTRPRTAKSDVSPPVWLLSCQATKAVSLSPKAKSVAARTLDRLTLGLSIVVVTSTSWPTDSPWLAEKTLALTLGVVAKVSALFCTQASRNRPPGSDAIVGEEVLI